MMLLKLLFMGDSCIKIITDNMKTKLTPLTLLFERYIGARYSTTAPAHSRLCAPFTSIHMKICSMQPANLHSQKTSDKWWI